jgi:hypothetical protein
MKKIVLCLLLLFSLHSFAQPAIQWEKSLGSYFNDYGYCIANTNDGGVIVAGQGGSGGDITGNHGSYDCWVVKLSNTGTIQWAKCYGGTDEDEPNSIIQTNDGGYIFAGYTISTDGDIVGNHGQSDILVVKLNDTGAIQWTKCYGGTGDDRASSIQQTTEGGFVIAGYTSSNDGDVNGNHGGGDCWIIKINDTGAIQWQKCYGGTNGESATSIVQTSDSGYAFTANTYSNDGDVTGIHGIDDYWVVKLDTGGAIQWAKCYGGSQDDEPSSIIQSLDGGYAVAGFTGSSDGDVSGNHGNYDYWIIKLSDTGALQWSKCLGGSLLDEAYSIVQTPDSNFVVAGVTGSMDGDVSGGGWHGSGDYWVVKLDINGNIKWQKCYGGTHADGAHGMVITTDGGYAIIGDSYSNEGDVTGHHGSAGSNTDYWVVKLAPDTATGINEINKAIDLVNIYPNPFNNMTTIFISDVIKDKNITLSTYSLLGQKVNNIYIGDKKEITFDRDILPAGMYFYKLIGDKQEIIAIGKLIIE